MQQLFAPSFAGQPKPPALMLRRLRRHREALMGPSTDRLFFAVLPDEATAARIAEKARHLRLSHGLTGKGVRSEHLHVTLCHVGDGIGLPRDVVDQVKKRAAGVTMPSFRVSFDRAGSFRNGALVLRGDDGTIGLEILQQRLSDALDGQPGRARPFTPHVTMLRDSYRVPEQRIEPIEWTVREVVLVHSLLGRTTHRHIARWSLTG
ncbi:MAG: RNA 2',3'-cyclic phosphodiesterase [Reyranella sp.]|uniref:RNA 2',3'-cyclic phosphodiesterase n=1 Tax=Reyranella sp. TaxID=1929291 RepID=UPI001AC34159|nr:RNA 2',3'-cyclic phosphodiesterase [Reyranella sp.]MBN9087651.1 RNA 2',3'-cyclic phosphodiesterase [Reyranella sp.]